MCCRMASDPGHGGVCSSSRLGHLPWFSHRDTRVCQGESRGPHAAFSHGKHRVTGATRGRGAAEVAWAPQLQVGAILGLSCLSCSLLGSRVQASAPQGQAPQSSFTLGL